MTADAITFAWPADICTTLAKMIHVQGGRILAKDASPNVSVFRYTEQPVSDLRSLYIAVRRAAATRAIALRAKPKGPVGNRRMHLTDGIEPYLEAIPRRWCAFDWDGLPLELQPCPNPRWSWQPHPLLEPWIGAQIALQRLPPQFRNASFFWQVSAGAGFNEGFRLRTWHWLDTPIMGNELKIWLKPAIIRNMVDRATLVEVQPHYLEVQVQGGADPCPRRFGFALRGRPSRYPTSRVLPGDNKRLSGRNGRQSGNDRRAARYSRKATLRSGSPNASTGSVAAPVADGTRPM